MNKSDNTTMNDKGNKKEVSLIVEQLSPAPRLDAFFSRPFF